MILIEEGTPKKLSGQTSLFLSCGYDERILEVIHGLEITTYDQKTKVWEVSPIHLQVILDSLCYIDDIILRLNGESSHNGSQEILRCFYKLKPFDYQEEAIKYGLSRHGWLLLDGMGLGKTPTAIALARELKERKKIDHCLIICGINTVKNNWLNEIRKFSDESAMILGQKVGKKGGISYASIKERATILKAPIDEFFVITNIESFQSKEIVEALKNGANEFGMIVIDECHRIKNFGSIQTKNVLKLDAPYKLGLTGTPLLNNPIDCYTQLRWVGADKACLTQFKRQYCEFGGFGGHEIVGYKNLELLKDELEANSLRRTKDDVLSLPPKNIIDELVDMSEAQKNFYDAIKAGVKEEADKIELNANSLLALVTRLRQATASPSILTTQAVPSAKIDRCLDLIEQITASGDKVVVFSAFKEPLSVIASRLSKKDYVLVTGDTKEGEAEASVDEFQTSSEKKIFLGTYAKCSTGINLFAASYMICLDESYVPAIQNQAQDRIYRIGQKRPVFIYNLICKGTIDERVVQILKRKQELSDYMLDGKTGRDDALDEFKDYILS